VYEAVVDRFLGVHPEVALGVARDALIVLSGRAREDAVEALAPFARRFRRATGTSPRRWLAAHRLELARSRLLASDVATLAAIAAEVGYATEFALSKAFKQWFGIAPGLLRRAVSAQHASSTPRFRAAA
jgi:methylphosphotriester-DNA--protein-cysteine methyltransferase